MAYTSATLSLNSPGPFNGTGKIWTYLTTDAATAVRVAGYFSDGWNRGMRVGDLVIGINTSTFAAQFYIVNAGSATVAIDVTDGLAIAATDTD